MFNCREVEFCLCIRSSFAIISGPDSILNVVVVARDTPCSMAAVQGALGLVKRLTCSQTTAGPFVVLVLSQHVCMRQRSALLVVKLAIRF